MADKEKTGATVYFDDYVLKWSDDGITIRVTDYHAGPLTLSWELVLDLAHRNGMKTPASGTQSSRTRAAADTKSQVAKRFRR